jgi:superfamily II RNA helicase
MVLNLLQTHTLEQARELIERSFGQYLATLYLKPQYEALAELENQLEHLQTQMDLVDAEQLDNMRSYDNG